MTRSTPPSVPRSAFAYGERAFRPARDRNRGGAVAAVFIWLVLAVCGILGTAAAAGQLATQYGLQGSSVLKMTIDACGTTGTGKNTGTFCIGHGNPQHTGVYPGEWTIDGSDHDYGFHTVVDVRCDLSGACTPIDTHNKAAALFGLGLSLLIASGMLLAALAVAAERYRPSWRIRLRNRRARRVLIAWFGALALLILTGAITALLT